MPARNQAKIRRDINRLQAEIQRHATAQPALAAIQSYVESATDTVNARWQAFQQAAVEADRERAERATALDDVRDWVQRWRPVVLLAVPGAAANTRALPPRAGTPDDMVRVAEDLQAFINDNPSTSPFRAAALGDLAQTLNQARTEVAEASAARPMEVAARAAYSEAVLQANTVLLRGTEVVRAIFGPTSPEYKQFIARSTPEEESQDDEAVQVGEA